MTKNINKLYDKIIIILSGYVCMYVCMYVLLLNDEEYQ